MSFKNIVLPSLLSTLTGAILDIALHIIFVSYLNLSILGSAIATSISLCYMLVFISVFIIIGKLYVDTWDGFTSESLDYLEPYAMIVFSSTIQACSEWWVWEIGIFISGYLGPADLGTQSVLSNLDVFWLQFPNANMIAVSILVGQYVSAENILGAITVTRVTMTVTLILAVLFDIFYFTNRYSLPRLFTNIDEIVNNVASAMGIVAIYIVFDGIALIMKGALIGIGKQSTAMVVTIVCYYVIALPIGISLMFATTLHSAGFFIGIAAGNILQCIILSVFTYHINWDEEVKNAKIRVSKASEDLLNDRKALILTTSKTRQMLNSHRNDFDDDESISDDKNVEAINDGNCRRRFNLTWACRLLVLLVIITCFVTGVICSVIFQFPVSRMPYNLSTTVSSFNNLTVTASII